ncbi:unnamed protein product [Amoebophrya sp. A25]|nr:unnamed protein product [Amoebophrya sp. A25]|eukprot:GSA25T00020591001.1
MTTRCHCFAMFLLVLILSSTSCVHASRSREADFIGETDLKAGQVGGKDLRISRAWCTTQRSVNTPPGGSSSMMGFLSPRGSPGEHDERSSGYGGRNHVTTGQHDARIDGNGLALHLGEEREYVFGVASFVFVQKL